MGNTKKSMPATQVCSVSCTKMLEWTFNDSVAHSTHSCSSRNKCTEGARHISVHRKTVFYISFGAAELPCDSLDVLVLSHPSQRFHIFLCIVYVQHRHRSCLFFCLFKLFFLVSYLFIHHSCLRKVVHGDKWITNWLTSSSKVAHWQNIRYYLGMFGNGCATSSGCLDSCMTLSLYQFNFHLYLL